MGQGVGLSSKSVKVVCDCYVIKAKRGGSEESRTIPPGWRGEREESTLARCQTCLYIKSAYRSVLVASSVTIVLCRESSSSASRRAQ